MIIEHFALNVPAPVEMATWYVKHLGMKIVRAGGEPTFTHFLADSSNKVMIEIYRNTKDPIPDYRAQHPLRVHLAFVAADPEAEKQRLLSAGCTYVEEGRLPDGSHLVMLRDPWGVPLQLCKRGVPMIG